MWEFVERSAWAGGQTRFSSVALFYGAGARGATGFPVTRMFGGIGLTWYFDASMKVHIPKKHPQAESAQFKAQAFRIVVIFCVLFGLGAIGLGVQHLYMQRTAIQNAQNTARRIAL